MGSRGLLLELCDLFHILGTVKGTQIGHWGPNQKFKISSKGVVKGSGDLFLEFWDLLHISATVKRRNVKFGKQIGH